jgi:hypothetical protein
MYTIEQVDKGTFVATYDERDALIMCEAPSAQKAEQMLLEELNQRR